MPNGTAVARRVRVEKNIYRRPDGKLEVGYRDSQGKQRYRVDGFPSSFITITEARRARDAVVGAKARGERVSPNPRLRFGDAADKWLAGPVASLRPATQAIYGSHVNNHLRPRFGRDRMDAITGDDIAKLVSDLRADGKSEWTISGIVKSCSQVYRYAAIRLAWHGANPTTHLERGERPKTSTTKRRRIYRGEELNQTLRAAHEPYRTLFAVAAVTGARESELLGLVWGDIELADLDAASLRFEYQVDRQGRRVELKTDESHRTVEIPRQLAVMLARHKLGSPYAADTHFAFASRSGRALGQRNVVRALKAIQKRAVDEEGRPTFPQLHDLPEGETTPRDAAPSFHGFRHSAASEAIAAGEGAEEVSWQLGHKSSQVTRAVYVQEIKTAERTAKRRAKMTARYGSTLDALDGSEPQQTASAQAAEVRKLRG